ncbi:hypothetical protein [Paenibacillus illinoisensis]|uniref:hypothetical protein n=1 Tax=Paenibacillus illinoisensis TaxID=59845 RepID=UPI003D989FCF
MKATQKIEVLLPVLSSLPFELEFNENILDVIKELVSTTYMFPLEAEQLNTHPVRVKFRLLDKDDPRINSLNTIGRRQYYILVYTELEIIDQPIEGIVDWNIPSIEFWTEITVNHFIKRLYDFILCINIARVGTFEVAQGIAYINNQFYKKTNMMISNFRDVSLFTQKTKWPPLDNMEIKVVWDWIIDKNGFLDGVGGTAIERALTALTYLFGSSGESIEGIDLFFTMIALEALYCSSNNGIKEQLIEKSQVFLGIQNEYKKLFKSMYDYRSKFIHGGLNFPGKYHYFDGDADYEKFSKESYDVTLMAQSVLIATLQQLSKRNMNELTFRYSLVGKNF